VYAGIYACCNLAELSSDRRIELVAFNFALKENDNSVKWSKKNPAKF